jgi:ribosomal protein L37E
MGIFNTKRENTVKCGKCGTEFDLELNKEGCPLCGFGRNKETDSADSYESVAATYKAREEELRKKVYGIGNYLAIPPQIKSSKGKPLLTEQTKSVGQWGMFNDYFSGKALLRICANQINENNSKNISLDSLIQTAKEVMRRENLCSLKGFPNDIKSESSVNRLVYHFVVGFYEMGMFEVELNASVKKNSLWNHDWEEIFLRPTEEGLEFARLKNKVFDEKKYEDQTLTPEERAWLLNYLKRLDKSGFKEYTLLKEIVSFMKKGKTGKDLEKWFSENGKFRDYLKTWSAKSDNEEKFEKQVRNLAVTFSASKISLLRELGIIKNERNNFKVIGDIE